MSRTHRRGMVKALCWDGVVRVFNRYWMKHDPTPYRRSLNQSFRATEKNFFQRFHETLVKTKNRGWYW